jgi:hypothetical protein
MAIDGIPQVSDFGISEAPMRRHIGRGWCVDESINLDRPEILFDSRTVELALRRVFRSRPSRHSGVAVGCGRT